ncbi:uncharacterized protein LOC117118586 isoform X2 [Anneissia japonica]|uniref:uncharacterized protein LOC117118586 isoform X2 n=1 Tax=Anneissia japonica TaxID=1529436 RepID=UPI001425A3B7|nr:uncharacterized protein LOC117118586 isoform X2 [Anneissia japonica]
MVHKNWGKHVSPISEGIGELAFLTVEQLPLDEGLATAVSKYIENLLKTKRCKLMRWSIHHILLYFPKSEDYDLLGNLFMEGKLDNCEGFRIVKIEPAVLTNPPKCFVEVQAEAEEGSKLQQEITSVVTNFSGAFTHLSVCETESPKTASQQYSCPPVAVSMLFTGQTQSLAIKTIEALSTRPWDQFLLSDEVRNAVEYETKYFVNTARDFPIIGVKTAMPISGVRISLFVNNFKKFSLMEEFYTKLTAVTPFKREVNHEEIRYCTFTLSQRSEFTLAAYPGVSPSPNPNLILYFNVRNASSCVPGARKVTDDHWQVSDPEGNKVILFTPLSSDVR